MAHINVKIKIEDEDGNCSEANFRLLERMLNNKDYMRSINQAAAQAWNRLEKQKQVPVSQTNND